MSLCVQQQTCISVCVRQQNVYVAVFTPTKRVYRCVYDTKKCVSVCVRQQNLVFIIEIRQFDMYLLN